MYCFYDSETSTHLSNNNLKVFRTKHTCAFIGARAICALNPNCRIVRTTFLCLNRFFWVYNVYYGFYLFTDVHVNSFFD